MVNDIQFQSALAAKILRHLAPLQLILAPGHHHKTQVGPLQNAIKEIHLNIGLQGNPFLLGQLAVDRIRQSPDPGEALFHALQICRLGLNLFQGHGVGGIAGMNLLLSFGQVRPLPGQFRLKGLLGLTIDGLAMFQ